MGSARVLGSYHQNHSARGEQPTHLVSEVKGSGSQKQLSRNLGKIIYPLQASVSPSVK